MNICGVSEKSCKSMTGFDIRRRLFKILPTMTMNNEETCNKVGQFICRPDVNRGIMGATALLTQPLIDYNNHKVDHETAAVSACRTAAKIIAGTSVGVAVRSGCYYLTDACTRAGKDANVSKWKKWLMPSKDIEEKISKHNTSWLKNYKNTLSVILGLSAMLVTNFLLDAPLTNILSKKFISKRNDKLNTVEQNERKVT